MVDGVTFSSRQDAGWLAACGLRLEDVVLEEDRQIQRLALTTWAHRSLCIVHYRRRGI